MIILRQKQYSYFPFEDLPPIHSPRTKSLMPEEIKDYWKRIDKAELDLLNKYKISPDDSFCDVWVNPFANFPKEDTWRLPKDTLQIGGVGDQGVLEIYYSPSQKKYYTVGYFSRSYDQSPKETNLQGIKSQILATLKNDLRELQNSQEDKKVVEFQRANIQLMSKIL